MKHVYTIKDLRENTLPANTRLAVIGCPVSHSASPQMHQVALDALGLEMVYIRIEIQPGDVKEAFSLMQDLGFLGCNVTIPHKLEAMECCDKLSDSVRLLGVANTISFKEGKVLGDNSDGPGLVQALEDDFGLTLKGLSIMILGAGGGAGRAIATQLSNEGCEKLYLSNRTVSKVEALVNDIGKTKTNLYALGNSYMELEQVAGDLDIIINATSMGMKVDDEVPFPIDSLTADHKIYDAIYNPPQTRLLESAIAKGALTSNGLSMLVNQGAISFEVWTGKKPDRELMSHAISL